MVPVHAKSITLLLVLPIVTFCFIIQSEFLCTIFFVVQLYQLMEALIRTETIETSSLVNFLSGVFFWSMFICPSFLLTSGSKEY